MEFLLIQIYTGLLEEEEEEGKQDSFKGLVVYIFLRPHSAGEYEVVMLSFLFCLPRTCHVPENQSELWPLGCAALLTVASPKERPNPTLWTCAHWVHLRGSTGTLTSPRQQECASTLNGQIGQK